MALVYLVIDRIDLDHRVARRNVGLYASDVAVTDARHLTAEVRPVAVTSARRLSAEDPPSDETGLYYEQSLLQCHDALPIYAFDTKPDMLVLVNSELEKPPDSSVVQPRPFYAS